MTGVITIISAGTGTGPFYIYSDVDGFTIPFISAVSKETLLLGLPVDNIPDGTTIVRVKSLNFVCNNYTDISVYPTTTTTTTAGEFNSYIYEMTALGCEGCSPSFGTDTLNNFEPLTVGKWYQANLGIDLALYVNTFLGGSIAPPDVYINDIDGVASCELLPCSSGTTTTTTTEAPTTTTTTTDIIPCQETHLYFAYLGYRYMIDSVPGTEVYFSSSNEDACAALDVLASTPGAGIDSRLTPYTDSEVISVGTKLYSNFALCDPASVTGFYIVSIYPSMIVEVLEDTVISISPCLPATTTTTTTTI